MDLLRWKAFTDHLDLPPIQEVLHLTTTQTHTHWMLGRGLEWEIQKLGFGGIGRH